MIVLHTIASLGDDGAEASDESSVTQKHVEHIDASSDELEILEAESPLATVPQLPEVRRAVESPHGAAFRRQEESEER